MHTLHTYTRTHTHTMWTDRHAIPTSVSVGTGHTPLSRAGPGKHSSMSCPDTRLTCPQRGAHLPLIPGSWERASPGDLICLIVSEAECLISFGRHFFLFYDPCIVAFATVLPGYQPFLINRRFFTHVHERIFNFKGQFSSVTQSCPTLCDPMDCSTAGLLVHGQLPELAQTHVR